MRRITKHPILELPEKKEVEFTWNGASLKGFRGEMISSSLIANDVHVFGHHVKDGSPQGIFCANGPCGQCLVMVDGRPIKSCMTPLEEGMVIESVEGLPKLPMMEPLPEGEKIPIIDTDVLVIGGGPAGLSASIELGRLGVKVLLVDDKDRLGGKLVLQTHKFFGSVADSHAGTRGFSIGRMLQEEVDSLPDIKVWTGSTVVGVFSDGIVGVVKGRTYRMVKPGRLLVATGAREKMLSFPGNTLPGVYGAGAFQTLVNRDLVRSSDRVLIVGGGNVGLIAGYHAIQAGIEVVALIEALPKVGGYKVHADKLARLGVPIFTGHTIVSAQGDERVERATIARLDKNWKIIPGTGRTFEVDTILIAVGLDEVNEFHKKAVQFGIPSFVAGDAQEIAEASAAMFTGKMAGRKVALSLGLDVGEIPAEWEENASILKSRPGPVVKREQKRKNGTVFPNFHCYQEIPCNPCTSVCPMGIIRTERDEITGVPYLTELDKCIGCLNCVGVCPGLAITVIDERNDMTRPTVTLPYEVEREDVEVGQEIMVTDDDGSIIGRYPVKKLITNPRFPGTLLVQVEVERENSMKAAGIRIIKEEELPGQNADIYEKGMVPDDAVICRCERVTAGEIRAAIRGGVRDLNQLKGVTRAGMGACGSKTCRPMILRMFREEGIDPGEVTDRVDRPLFVEVPLGYFAGLGEGDGDE